MPRSAFVGGQNGHSSSSTLHTALLSYVVGLRSVTVLAGGDGQAGAYMALRAAWVAGIRGGVPAVRWVKFHTSTRDGRDVSGAFGIVSCLRYSTLLPCLPPAALPYYATACSLVSDYRERR